MPDHAAPRTGPTAGAMPGAAPARVEAADVGARLAGAVADGNPRAVEVLYEAWFERGLGLARSLTRRDEAWCLDVVHDAFVRVIGSGRALRKIGSAAELDRWMARVVHTAALDVLRREARRAARERKRAGIAGAEAGGTPPHPAPPFADEIARLRASMDQIDADDGALLRQRFGASRTIEGAGSDVGMTAGAAHGRIRRALARLRGALKENGDE